MTSSKAHADVEEEARRLVQLEERMLASLGDGIGKVVHQLADQWGVSSAQVKRYVTRIKARWKAEAATIQDRAERRMIVRKAIEDAAYEARCEGKLQVQLNAIQMLMDLDGLAEPVRVEQIGQPQSVTTVVLSIDEAERLASGEVPRLAEVVPVDTSEAMIDPGETDGR